MIVFFTRSAQHLSVNSNFPIGSYTVKQFSDGELYLKLEQHVSKQEVWVVTSTQPPAENLLELFFLLDALTTAGAQKINLFFSYFAYARQAHPLPGEARSTHLISEFLQKFPINNISIMHVHAAFTLHSFLNFTDIIPMDFFCRAGQTYDVIAAPDQGAAEFAKKVSQQCHKEFVFLQKKRPKHEAVIIESVVGNVEGKKVLLVDDIIATGSTIIEAARSLLNAGALEVSAAATHGIFANDAYQKLQKGGLKKIYVTNSFKQQEKNNVEVYDIAHILEKVLITP